MKTRIVRVTRELGETFLSTGNRIAPAVVEAGVPQGARLVWARFLPDPGYVELIFEHESFEESATDGPLLPVNLTVALDAGI
jgi:hypothetical protein